VRRAGDRACTRATASILRVQPRISIWFHQHERVVDESGGGIAVERRFSALVGLPLRRLPREPGWQGEAIWLAPPSPV
jgi:hypothetical protein